jgi:hypothetical protein
MGPCWKMEPNFETLWGMLLSWGKGHPWELALVWATLWRWRSGTTSASGTETTRTP